MKQAIALLLAVYMLLAVLAGCTAKTTTDAEPALSRRLPAKRRPRPKRSRQALLSSA